MEQIKEQMTHYWSERVPSFSRLRMKERNPEKARLWMAEFRKYIPMDRQLKILDLGTGTGFFAFLLAEAGHQVTGIDLTEPMIREAERTAKVLNIPARFCVMDAEAPAFPDGSFDVLVSRNLTWALPHLDKAYENWHRLLKPGGLLINFDADYCREDPSPALPENHAHKDISQDLACQYETMKASLRPMQQPRPQWDRLLLAQAGFRQIQVDTQVWQRIYARQDEFYNPTPIFTLTAQA